MQRWIIFSILASLLAATALQAASRGWADLYYYPVMRVMGQPGTPADQRRSLNGQAAEFISQALRWDPRNPNIQRMQARLQDRAVAQQMQDRYFWESTAAIRPQYRLALKQFEQAVLKRPSSPYLWSDIVRIKYRLGEVDAQMQASLQQAMKLGPWVTWVQAHSAQTGFAVWGELSAETQAALLENLQRGSQKNHRFMLAIINKNQLLPVLCEKFGNRSQFGVKCP